MKFLFVDEILELHKGKTTVGIKKITQNDYYLISDNNSDYFIPSLVGEALGQLTAYNVMLTNNFLTRPVAGIVSNAILHRPVKVGETLVLKSVIDSLDNQAVQYHGAAYVDEREVFVLESALGPLLPMHEFMEDKDIKAQFNAIMDKQNIVNSKESKNLIINAVSFDKITYLKPNEQLSVVKKIKKNEAFFPDHFPKKPVLPMTMLLEYKRNLAKLFFLKSNLAKNYQLQKFARVKMNDFIYPDEEITCTLKLKTRLEDKIIVNFITEVRKKRVCVSEAVFGLGGVS